MFNELVVQLTAHNLTGVQVGGGCQHARRAGIDVLVERLVGAAALL